MAENPTNLIWIDLEMTGLNTKTDKIIEIATIITDSNLNTLAQGPVIAIKQSNARLDAMDEWNTKHHTESGLVARVKSSTINEAEAEKLTLDFIKQWVPANKSPICGNSICQDRRFLANSMPTLENYFHYRNLDVSSLKILAERWAPRMSSQFKKKSSHKALEDIIESIEELKFYRRHFLKIE
jgi:oligoribonuclease